MVEISLSVLLLPYAILLVIFVIYSIFNLYHLFSFGFLSFASYLATFIFLAGVILVLFITYKLGSQIDWTQTIVF